MFGSEAVNRIIRWIGPVVLGCIFGVVVERVGSLKPEAGRAGQAGNVLSQRVIPPAPTKSGSVVEGSQKKGVRRPSEILRLVSLAQDDARGKLRQIYTSQIGIREKTGKNDGPDVEKYLRYIGLPKGYSYCAAYVCWCLNDAGIDNPKNGWAPALFPAKRVVTTPRTGDIFGIYFSELKRIAHCGFVDSWNGTWMISVEANTNDIGSVSSANDPSHPIRAGPGEGVYRKKRLIKTIYKVADWISE